MEELKLNRDQAAELCDALELHSGFFDEDNEEYIMLKQQNPSLLAAFETLFTIANT